MHPNTNNIQTHQFNWNAWLALMCKMKCYENLNGEALGIWESHWNIRLEPFYNGTITCGYVECPETYTELLTEWIVNLNNEVIPQMQAHNFVSSCSVQNNVYVKGSRRYELSNHLGNVLAIVSDRKIESDEDYFYAGLGSGFKFENGTYKADVDGEYRQNSGPDGIISSYFAEVISANDYYAFGSLMPGRSFSGGEYKFGFNGQERDDEVSGAGNTMTAEFWEYDSRLGRRWNCDPVVKSWISSFHAFSNKPIVNVDPNGANDDDYKLNKDGSIDLINKTDDPFDRIYATDQKGDFDCSESIEVEKGVLGGGKTAHVPNIENPSSPFVKVDIYKIQGDESSKKLFEFVAKNSNVEWSLTMTGEKGEAGLNYLTTSHLEGAEIGFGLLLYYVLIYKELQFRVHIHNHPKQSNASPPDISIAKKLQKNYPGSQFFIYKSKKETYIEYNGNSSPIQLLDEFIIRPRN